MLHRRSPIINKFLHFPDCGRSENTKTDKKKGLKINKIKEGIKRANREFVSDFHKGKVSVKVCSNNTISYTNIL